MAHKILQLIGDAEAKLAAELEELEAKTGYTSQDVKLLGQNAHAVKSKIADLMLDPDDTTPEELYHALRARYLKDARVFQLDFDLQAGTDGQHLAIQLASRVLGGLRLWTLKTAYAKDMLRKLPPLRTKKVLGYRSLDSMLKRADMAFVVALAAQLESSTWLAKWRKALNSAPAAKRELTDIKIIITDHHGLVDVCAAPDVAAILVPLKKDFEPASGIGQILEILAATRVLSVKDLSRELANVHPALRWWSQNLHLSAWIDDQPISFNVFDVARDAESGVTFENRSYRHAGNHMWQKLNDSYRNLMSEFTSTDFLQTDLAVPLPVMVEVEADDA